MQGAGSMQGMLTPVSGGAGAAAAAAAGAGGTSSTSLTGLLDRLADDLTFTLDRKAETEQALLEDLLSSLRNEKRKIEEDVWRYGAPRSQPKLIS